MKYIILLSLLFSNHAIAADSFNALWACSQNMGGSEMQVIVDTRAPVFKMHLFNVNSQNQEKTLIHNGSFNRVLGETGFYFDGKDFSNGQWYAVALHLNINQNSFSTLYWKYDQNVVELQNLVCHKNVDVEL